jgi:TRAP-type C4-dicarboxylate transport system substrate-binding protein
MTASTRMRALALLASALVGASALAACGSQSNSDGEPTVNLKLASYTGSSAPDNIALVEWSNRVKELTGGTVEIEIFNQGSLLPATDILPGVKDRRADLGSTVAAYHPRDLVLSAVAGIPFVSDNVPAQGEAFLAMARQNAAYQAEFDRQGVHLLFNWITGAPLLGCSEPVTSLADLRGRNVRAVGLNTTSWANVGANLATLPATEVYEAMERGVLDCWTTIAMESVTDFGLHEVTPYIYDTGHKNFGQFHIFINNSVWESLSDEQRAAMDQASEEIVARMDEISAETYAQACQKMKASAELSVFPAALQSAWRDLEAGATQQQFLDSAREANVDGQAFLTAYKAALAQAETNHADYEPPFQRCVSES